METSGPDSGADDLRADDWFRDATDRSGIDFSYRNGREGGRFYLIESFGGGAALMDYDLDGDVDLFVTGGGTISSDDPVQIGGRVCPLFRNEQNLQFREVTAEALFPQPAEYSQGCAVSDFDGDGFSDLFVCGVGASRLVRNQGDGTYAAIPDSALAAPGWGTAAAFGDFDRDGFPDLFLARYTQWDPATDVACRNHLGTRDLCGPTSYAGTICLFLHNCGDGRFEDWSQRAGITDEVRGLGVVALDLNLDGWIDFFVASDESPNRLYLGGPQLRFSEAAISAGVALGEWGAAQGSMGVAVADYDGDGRPDLWITNFENEDDSLYRNLGDGMFVHAATAAGLSGLTRMRVGFGTELADFDGDGWPDLFVLNGNTSYSTGQSPFRQLPQLFHNVQGRRFEDVSTRGGTFFRSVHAGRGAAVGDLNDDGSLDLVTIEINDRVRIQTNQRPPANFAAVKLVARQGERDATGSRAWTEFEGRRLVGFVTRGTGFFSQSDSRLIFPMRPDQSELDVTVAWVGRKTERFSGLQPGRTNVLIEGRGVASDEPR